MHSNDIRHQRCATNSSGGAAATTAVSDTYWADFLFGTTSAYSLANYYEAHLTQNIHSVYAQDDWKVSSSLTLNLGLRWEYGSPYADLYNRVSNFDPNSQTVLTTTPGAVAGNGITPYSGGGTYGKTLVNPDHRLRARVSASPMRSIPRLQFAADLASATPTTRAQDRATSSVSTRRRRSLPRSPRSRRHPITAPPASRPDHRNRDNDSVLLCNSRSGLSQRPGYQLQLRDRQHHLHPQEH
jgi:hypothetical protein